MELVRIPFFFLDLLDSLKLFCILEIIPSGSLVGGGDDDVLSITVQPDFDIGSKSPLINSDGIANDKTTLVWTSFVFVIPYMLSILCALSLAPVSYVGIHPNDYILLTVFDGEYFAAITFFWGLFTLTRMDLMEMWIAFLTWSFPYLFIRRFMNPENNGFHAFTK